jgi:hypothetical protein
MEFVMKKLLVSLTLIAVMAIPVKPVMGMQLVRNGINMGFAKAFDYGLKQCDKYFPEKGYLMIFCGTGLIILADQLLRNIIPIPARNFLTKNGTRNLGRITTTKLVNILMTKLYSAYPNDKPRVSIITDIGFLGADLITKLIGQQIAPEAGFKVEMFNQIGSMLSTAQSTTMSPIVNMVKESKCGNIPEGLDLTKKIEKCQSKYGMVSNIILVNVPNFLVKLVARLFQ